MPPEYSYFRAEGQSLMAIEQLLMAWDETAALRKKITDHFGADDVSAYVSRETGKLKINYLTFNPPNAAPPGWVEVYDAGDRGRYVLPAPDTADSFYLASMAGLMERTARRQSLEDVLGSPEMTWRDMEDGQRPSQKFVRYTMAELAAPEKPSGQIYDRVSGTGFVTGAPWRAADPIVMTGLEEIWYLRVPNKPGTDIPQFVPPDAVQMSYDTMLMIDKREQVRRFNSTHKNTFKL